MEELLRWEGVEFDEVGCVKLDKHLWKPGISSSSRSSSSKKKVKKKKLKTS
jgi:hypothetical protein